MRKIIIIEKESATINRLAILATTLQFEPLVLHGWNNILRTINREDMAAFFINVEIENIDLKKIIRYINPPSESEIPVIFMFIRNYSNMYKAASRVPHHDEIQKPFKLEQLFQLLHRHVAIDELSAHQSEYSDQIQRFVQEFQALENWGEQLKRVLKG